jgi:hypothetical protein
MEYKLEQDDSLGVEEEIIQKLSPTWNLIRDILPEQKDQEFLLMMMDGVRESTAFAILLNIVDLPKEEQAKIIKRHKDRIKKTILRHITSEELKKAK